MFVAFVNTGKIILVVVQCKKLNVYKNYNSTLNTISFYLLFLFHNCSQKYFKKSYQKDYQLL